MFDSIGLQRAINTLPMINTISALRIYPSKATVEFIYRKRKIRITNTEGTNSQVYVYEVIDGCDVNNDFTNMLASYLNEHEDIIK